MNYTQGINHLGLSVKDLFATRDFFVKLLGWTESGYDAGYPRTAVSDGTIKLTLWQVDHSKTVTDFDRRQNIGLHHLALEVASEERLNRLYQHLKDNNVDIDFAPEPVSGGPRMHMMCHEPGGIRIEFIWPGQ